MGEPQPEARRADPGKPGEPQRTCIACRLIRPKAELIRLVRREDGGVSVDHDGRAAGRGAYVCPTADCLGKALHAARLGHAFKGVTRPPQESPTVILAGWPRR